MTEAGENDESRRMRPILRQRSQGGAQGGLNTRRNRTGKAAFRLAAIFLTGSRARRIFVTRSIATARFARHHYEITHRALLPERSTSSDEVRPTHIGMPDRPSSAAEIIKRLLANGYTMLQIRTLFPALFSSPGPGG